MNGGTLPSGAEFKRRINGTNLGITAVGLTILLCSLRVLLELTPKEWTWIAAILGAYAVVVSYPIVRVQRRLLGPIAAYLDGRGGEADRPRIRREAFAAAMDLPRCLALLDAAVWMIPSVVVAVVMAIEFDRWGLFESGVLIASTFASAFFVAAIVTFMSKHLTQRPRDALTAEMPDPVERRSLIRPVSLRTKLLTCVTGVAVVPMIFSVLLFASEVDRSLERFTIRWQNDILDKMQNHADSKGGADGLSAAKRGALAATQALPVPINIRILDLEHPDETGAAGLIEGDVLDYLQREVDRGSRHGDSSEFPSNGVFTWRQRNDGKIVLALSPASELASASSRVWLLYAALFLGAALMAFCLAYLIANDVGRAARTLRVEADRMASGDLRQGRVFESEDELGDLSRSFGAMAQSLRTTVARVAEAADQVESTASEMAAIAESVATVTASQVSGIQEAARSMEAINTQVQGIADSSQALNVSVEESSSTILELGAAGEELNDTASVLSLKVSEVSSSIEEMVASVRQVSENTEALADAAVETSTSMEEMASSMREVNTSADETATLSRQVVESAEAGQIKVRQTIEGMNAIREATETAERVIRNLGSRTKEIGAIIDVIDDVADETNLLALNAAIIAAQAGEQGRAFSVVADEIKDLADRVLASTKEVGNLISAVQEESSNAIGAIEQGTHSVAEGVDLSAAAGISLEEITQASRESGNRIFGIVTAVREQAKAAAHVAELMERVRGGVDEIRGAASEQEKGNEVVYRSALAMRDVAQQVRGTTEEQARGSGRIRESVDSVREAVEKINGALQEQSVACRSVVEFLEEVSSRAQSNEQSSRRMDGATKTLLKESAALREDVHRFRV